MPLHGGSRMDMELPELSQGSVGGAMDCWGFEVIMPTWMDADPTL